MVASRVKTLRNMVTGPAPVVSIERPVLYTESMRLSEGEPMILRHAKALAHVLENMTVKILPGEIIVGAIVDEIPGATLYPEGIGARVIPELEDLESRSHSSLTISQEAIDTLTNEVDCYWYDKSMLAYAEENTPEEIMDTLY
ncbi:MAG: formate C-acetyltransferase/glycerol dehydratase family glycyl radical enzyme, partial [Candidatus Thorarchaeota archaeon]